MINEPTTRRGDLRLYVPARYPPANTPTVATAQGGAVKSCEVNGENPNPIIKKINKSF